MSEEYDLKKSENKIGQLYPILVTKDGKIIDGFHRKDADPNWKSLVVPEIDTEEKLLLARLIANFHRRHVEEWEKKEWINGLAKIYVNQGFKVQPEQIGSAKPTNEIIVKLMEATGLSKKPISALLADEFKQERFGGGIMTTSASEKVEKLLGEKGAEKYKKDVVAESKLTPQEKAALTRKRQQEREKKQREAEIKKREKEEKKKLDAEKRRKQAEEREVERLRKQKEEKLKEAERKRQEEEKRKQYEQKIREDAEKATRQKLLKDTDFQSAVIEEVQKRGRQSSPKGKDKTCSNGTCATSQIIGNNEPETDVRSEQIAEFWKLHSHCLCKNCNEFTSCTVIR